MAKHLVIMAGGIGSSFYYYPNEDHIALSHALFRAMSKPLVKKLDHHQAFLLLRKYEEEIACLKK